MARQKLYIIGVFSRPTLSSDQDEGLPDDLIIGFYHKKKLQELLGRTESTKDGFTIYYKLVDPCTASLVIPTLSHERLTPLFESVAKGDQEAIDLLSLSLIDLPDKYLNQAINNYYQQVRLVIKSCLGKTRGMQEIGYGATQLDQQVRSLIDQLTKLVEQHTWLLALEQD